jgi:hypothetical protein
VSRASSQIRRLAERLVAAEKHLDPTAADKVPAPFRVCEKLRPELATLMGRTGFHALLSRALAMARREVDWLGTVTLTEDGSLGGEGLEKPSAEELAEGSKLLVAELLGLLEAFIGENLTVRLVREVWPELPLDDDPFPPGDPS